MPRVALVRGPYLRPDGVRPWEYLHNHSEYDVTAFESNPSRFDTSELEMPVKELRWIDGSIDAFGYDHVLSRAIRKARFPSDYLVGISKLTESYDIINTSENFNLFSFQAALACRSNKTRFVFTAAENIPYPRFQHNPVQWLMKRFVNIQADHITTNTPVGKRALVHEGVKHDKISVVPDAIDYEMFQPQSQINTQPTNFPDDISTKDIILFVHGLKEQKGVPDLLDAFELISKDRRVQLVLIGSNQLNSEYVNRIREDEAIQWLERVPYQSMPDLYNLADIFVLPSVTMVNNEEQFGMAALEAMSCEVPTVVTDTGGLPYVAEDGRTSIVVSERSPTEIAEALNRLLDSPGLREKMGSNGRKRAKRKFSPEATGEKIRTVYNEIV